MENFLIGSTEGGKFVEVELLFTLADFGVVSNEGKRWLMLI